MSSLIPHDYRYKISSPTPVDKEPKKHSKSATIRIGAGEENRTLTVSLEG